MDIIVGNGHGNTSLNLDEAVYISHSAFVKGMNPTNLPPDIGKIVGMTVS